MPKYKKANKKAKAKLLSKTFIKNGFSQVKTAKELGITSQAVGQQVSQPIVQDAIQEYLDSPKLKNKLISVADEGLSATRVISAVVFPDGKDKDATGQSCDFIEVPDHNARHKYWRDLMTAIGKLNVGIESGNVFNTKIIQLIIQSGQDTPLMRKIGNAE